MARSFVTDPLLSHHFALIDVPTASIWPLAFPAKMAMSAISSGSFIGFSDIELPEPTIETREIKEGNYPYVHTLSTGFVTTGEVRISMALMPTNFEMYLWFRQSILGRVSPRRHLLVVYLRADKRIPYRYLLLEGCIPTAWKPSGDLSATSSEVLIESLTCNVHRVSFIPKQ